MENESDDHTQYEKYLKPNKDPHIRIGNSYQAKIPTQIDHSHDNISPELTHHINLEKHLTTEEEVDDMRPTKKRRLDS
jgi:hypothetical protein